MYTNRAISPRKCVSNL